MQQKTPHPLLDLAYFILLALACALFAMFLGLLLAIPLFGLSLNQVMAAITNFSVRPNIGLLKYFQVLQSLGLFVVPPLVYQYIWQKRTGIQYFNVALKPSPWIYAMAAALIFAAMPVINLLAYLNESLSLPSALKGLELRLKTMEENAAVLTDLLLSGKSATDLMVNLVMIALIPAVGEELVFRGAIQTLLTRWFKNIHVGIIVSALLFSAIHMQFYGFVPRMLMGVMFGYLVFYTGTIWVSVVAHFTNNALAVIVYYYMHGTMAYEKIEHLGVSKETWPILLASAVLTCFFMLKYYQHHKISDLR
ncbi:MAG: CPBP family intramembrane metalloprotease [Bacteroidales bacterium]|nr:CPBP family intramembrane metalloprotease [Bacteroidales bacterium]